MIYISLSTRPASPLTPYPLPLTPYPALHLSTRPASPPQQHKDDEELAAFNDWAATYGMTFSEHHHVCVRTMYV